MTSKQVAEQARALADNLRADIPNAQTRIEHMRLTRLWVEADGLATTLEYMAERPNLPQDREHDGFITDGHFPTH